MTQITFRFKIRPVAFIEGPRDASSCDAGHNPQKTGRRKDQIGKPGRFRHNKSTVTVNSIWPSSLTTIGAQGPETGIAAGHPQNRTEGSCKAKACRESPEDSPAWAWIYLSHNFPEKKGSRSSSAGNILLLPAGPNCRRGLPKHRWPGHFAPHSRGVASQSRSNWHKVWIGYKDGPVPAWPPWALR